MSIRPQVQNHPHVRDAPETVGSSNAARLQNEQEAQEASQAIIIWDCVPETEGMHRVYSLLTGCSEAAALASRTALERF